MIKEKDLTTFIMAFENQNVIITTSLSNNQILHDENGMPLSESVPLFYEGVLLDQDEEYYYLGEASNANEITQAISKKFVIHVMVHEQKDEYEMLLDQLESPKDKKDIN